MFSGIYACAQVSEWKSSSILTEPLRQRAVDKKMVYAKHSLNRKTYQHLGQLKFIRE